MRPSSAHRGPRRLWRPVSREPAASRGCPGARPHGTAATQYPRLLFLAVTRGALGSPAATAAPCRREQAEGGPGRWSGANAAERPFALSGRCPPRAEPGSGCPRPRPSSHRERRPHRWTYSGAVIPLNHLQPRLWGTKRDSLTTASRFTSPNSTKPDTVVPRPWVLTLERRSGLGVSRGPAGYTGHSPWPPGSGKGSGASPSPLRGLGCCVGATGALTPPEPGGQMPPALQPLPIFVPTSRGRVSKPQQAVSQFPCHSAAARPQAPVT